jgi:hypothetical protein
MGRVDAGFAVNLPDLELAELVLAEAGFLTRIGEPDGACDPETQMVVWASRSYAGGYADTELRQAHCIRASQVLATSDVVALLIGSPGALLGEPTREPLRAVGTVLAAASATGPQFAGSCFALRHTNHVLTAAHCVAGEPSQDFYVSFLGGTNRYPVVEVIPHPTADLALLRLAPDLWPSGVDPFAGYASIERWGQDFAGFGSVVDGGLRSSNVDAREPTARLFKGHFQRVFESPKDGHLAAEMSIAASAGFSGGPIFQPNPPCLVLAVVIGNWESSITLESVETETSAGTLRETSIQKVISYGIALPLADFGDWLDEHLPDVPRAP